MGLSVQEKKFQIYFQGDGVRFPMGTILAIFYLQVTKSTKFRVNLPFGSGQEINNNNSKRFLKWPWRPSWISDRNDLS